MRTDRWKCSWQTIVSLSERGLMTWVVSAHALPLSCALANQVCWSFESTVTQVTAVCRSVSSSRLHDESTRSWLCPCIPESVIRSADGFGNTSNLAHQHKSFINRILWLEYWLEQQESQLVTRGDFKAGQWIQGTNTLIGLYSRLEEITKHTRKRGLLI